jgi:hypothetical protein
MFLCAHCGQALVGYATLDAVKLCSPAYGLDCFWLVTVYAHSMPCAHKPCAASVRARRLREAGNVNFD